jgi:hypothetical protein
MEYLINEQKKKKSVVLSIEEFEALKKEMEFYKKTIEELQDDLDSIEAEKIRHENKETTKFQLRDYVSNRNRTVSSKNLKKITRNHKRTNSKVYS